MWSVLCGALPTVVALSIVVPEVLAGGWINVSDCAVLHCGQGGLASRQAGHMERMGWEGPIRLGRAVTVTLALSEHS